MFFFLQVIFFNLSVEKFGKRISQILILKYELSNIIVVIVCEKNCATKFQISLYCHSTIFYYCKTVVAPNLFAYCLYCTLFHASFLYCTLSITFSNPIEKLRE